MSSYLILFAIFAIIAVIYFVLVHNKPAPKTDWEQLPQLDEYKKLKNQSMQIINPAVVFVVIVKSIKDYYNPRKNPDNTKHYHACAACRRVLWRSVAILTKKTADQP